MLRTLTALALVMGAAAPAYAQDAMVKPAAPAAVPAQALEFAPVAAPTVLRSGTPVSLKLREELTTKGKKLRVGQRFNMEVAEDVRLGSVVVIPAGTPAVGEITDVRNKGMWGKSGRIGARPLYARIGDRQIRLSGAMDDKGVTGTAGVIGAVALIPIAGFLMTGTSAVIPLGATIQAFLDEDVQMQAVQTVAAPAPAAVVVVPAPPIVTMQPIPSAAEE